MYESDVTNWLYNECKTVLSSSSVASVSTPSDHVDLTSDRDEVGAYPFIGIRPLSTTKESAGLGNGDVFVEDITYQNGVLQSITFRKEPTLRVELVPLSDGDRQLKTDLGDEISDHFDVMVRTDNHPDDVAGVSVGEATVQNRSGEFVYADGLPVEVSYNHYIERTDITTADTVNLDVDVGDSVNVDAFDEMF